MKWSIKLNLKIFFGLNMEFSRNLAIWIRMKWSLWIDNLTNLIIDERKNWIIDNYSWRFSFIKKCLNTIEKTIHEFFLTTWFIYFYFSYEMKFVRLNNSLFHFFMYKNGCFITLEISSMSNFSIGNITVLFMENG